jgi:hypothetical protein
MRSKRKRRGTRDEWSLRSGESVPEYRYRLRLRVEMRIGRNRYFNCPLCFIEKDALLISLHEAGHLLCARTLGVPSIDLVGPQIRYNSEDDILYPSRGSIIWRQGPTDIMKTLQSFVASYLFRRELTDSPNAQNAIDNDLQFARKWYDAYHSPHEREPDAIFKSLIDLAIDETISDLRSPAFRRLAWDTAREFQRQVFGPDGSARSQTAEDIGEGILCPKHSVEAGEFGSETEWQIAQVRRKMREARAA